MPKGDVVGVAAYPDGNGGVATFAQVDDGNGGERRGFPVVWCSDRKGWATPKADEEISDGERRAFRNRPVPGELMDPQPPQVPAELPAEVIERGVTAKARAILVADGGGPAMVTEYLRSRLEVRLTDREMTERIAAAVGVPAPKMEG